QPCFKHFINRYPVLPVVSIRSSNRIMVAFDFLRSNVRVWRCRCVSTQKYNGTCFDLCRLRVTLNPAEHLPISLPFGNRTERHPSGRRGPSDLSGNTRPRASFGCDFVHSSDVARCLQHTYNGTRLENWRISASPVTCEV